MIKTTYIYEELYIKGYLKALLQGKREHSERNCAKKIPKK